MRSMKDRYLPLFLRTYTAFIEHRYIDSRDLYKKYIKWLKVIGNTDVYSYKRFTRGMKKYGISLQRYIDFGPVFPDNYYREVPREGMNMTEDENKFADYLRDSKATRENIEEVIEKYRTVAEAGDTDVDRVIYTYLSRIGCTVGFLYDNNEIEFMVA